MYENYETCPQLSPKEKCVRVLRYNDGVFAETFHEHAPSHRLSVDGELDSLRALIEHCAGWNETFILYSRLNSRKGGPSRYPRLISHVSYPEAGVIRRYLSSSNVIAWFDTVILPHDFRRQSARDDV